MRKYVFITKDLDCAACGNKIQEKLSKVDGIENVIVNFGKLEIKYETDTYSKVEVEKMIQEIEPEVTLVEIPRNKTENIRNESKINRNLFRLFLGIFFMILGVIIKNNIISTSFILIAYILCLYRTVKNAIKALKTSREINENLLVTISCVGAYLVGEQLEGLMVIILYEIGKILEDKAVNKTRKSISTLMDIRPEYANLKQEDSINKVSPDCVKVGDIIIIKPGEKIPLDGEVVKGSSSLNTSSLTGESKLTKVNEGDKVISGSINVDGILEIEVTEEYENSTVNKILELVENATDKKAKTETIVNKFAKIYTPIVIVLAIFVAIILPVITSLNYSESIYRALTFLVISCPCAIAISVPLSYFSGIGKASKNGILIKGSDFLDNLKLINKIVFDKTGTLTKGEFGVSKIEKYGSLSEDEILKFSALGESYSNHPIAKAILKNVDFNINIKEVEDYREISGKGLEYTYNGKRVLIGNRELVGYNDSQNDCTKIYVKIDDEVIGAICLEDCIKPGVKDALDELRELVNN